MVDLIVTPNNQITVEIDSFDGISLDDCVELSQYIETNINKDIEDYDLEVSSAGLTSPFKVHQQYIKNKGKEVEILSKTGEKYSGILQTVTSENIVLLTEKMLKPEGSKRKIAAKEEITFSFQNIKTTKLIIRFK